MQQEGSPVTQTLSLLQGLAVGNQRRVSFQPSSLAPFSAALQELPSCAQVPTSPLPPPGRPFPASSACNHPMDAPLCLQCRDL